MRAAELQRLFSGEVFQQGDAEAVFPVPFILFDFAFLKNYYYFISLFLA